VYLEVWSVRDYDLFGKDDSNLFAVAVGPDGAFEVVLPRSDEYVARILENGTGRSSSKRIGDELEINIQ